LIFDAAKKLTILSALMKNAIAASDRVDGVL
jgi:hypothetical protein